MPCFLATRDNLKRLDVELLTQLQQLLDHFSVSHVSKPITPDCRAVLLHLASSAKLAILHPRRHEMVCFRHHR